MKLYISPGTWMMPPATTWANVKKGYYLGKIICFPRLPGRHCAADDAPHVYLEKLAKKHLELS
jgi:hypothetical protein